MGSFGDVVGAQAKALLRVLGTQCSISLQQMVVHGRGFPAYPALHALLSLLSISASYQPEGQPVDVRLRQCFSGFCQFITVASLARRLLSSRGGKVH